MKKIIAVMFALILIGSAAVAEDVEQLFRALSMMDASGGIDLAAERASIILGTELKATGSEFIGEIKLSGAAYKVSVRGDNDLPRIALISANPSAKFSTVAKPVNPFYSVMCELFGEPSLDRCIDTENGIGGNTLSTPKTKKGTIDIDKVSRQESLINISWQNTDKKLAASIFGKRIGSGSHMELDIFPGVFTGRQNKEEPKLEPTILVSDDPIQKLQIADKPAPFEFGISAAEAIKVYSKLNINLQAEQERIISWSGPVNSEGRTGIILSEGYKIRSFQYDGTYLDKTEFLFYSPTGIMKGGRRYDNNDVLLYGVRMTFSSKTSAKLCKAFKKEFTAKYGNPSEDSSVGKRTTSVNGNSKSTTYYPHLYRWQLADNIGIRIEIDTDAKGNPLQNEMTLTIMQTDKEDKLKR